MPRKIGNLTLYSIDDLHEMLGISKMTLRAYLRDGKIRGRKLGVSWFVTEGAIKEYFEEPQTSAPVQKPAIKSQRYIVQGINDLVSESEECDTIEEALQVLSEQAIISLFQVKVIDKNTQEILEVITAREFIEQHAEV